MAGRRKTGILGGTFDPVHVAHLILAECAYRQFGLDEVLLIPNGDPPHKVGKKTSPGFHRLRMLRIAAEGVPYFHVSGMELEREGLSYTSDTLQQLKKDNPDTDYYFIMGGDSLFQIETWHEPARIMASCRILVGIRGQESLESHQEQARSLIP